MGYFGATFAIFPILFFCMFILVFGFVIYNFFNVYKHNKKNANSPVLTVEAKVVAKRADYNTYNRRVNDNNMIHKTTSTNYYATFEVESGDRMELEVYGNEYGMLIEGDKGRLTFQGTRFKDFKRI